MKKQSNNTKQQCNKQNVNGSFETFHTSKLHNRYFKSYDRIIKLTFSHWNENKEAVYHFEWIKNNIRKGVFIIGFRLYDYMSPVTAKDWKTALLNCR